MFQLKDDSRYFQEDGQVPEYSNSAPSMVNPQHHHWLLTHVIRKQTPQAGWLDNNRTKTKKHFPFFQVFTGITVLGKQEGATWGPPVAMLELYLLLSERWEAIGHTNVPKDYQQY